MSQRHISEAFIKICELGKKLGIPPLNTLPGLWEHRLDEYWEIKVNGQKREIGGIAPFSAGIFFNGWPAGIINPYGGQIVRSHDISEDLFIEAIEAAIATAAGAA